MAGFAGDDPFGFDFDFDFEDDGDNDAFCYDPFDDYGGDEDEGEGLIVCPVIDDGDGDGDGEVLCVSGFAFLDGESEDGGDVLVGEDRASEPADEDPILETLGRSFDSDGGFSEFLPHLVSALEASDDEDEEEDELMPGDGRGGGGLELELGPAIEELDDDDSGIGLGLMLSGFTLDPRPDTDEDATSDDDMGEGGGLVLGGGFDLLAPRVVRPGWMVMGAEGTDSDAADLNLLEMLAGRVGEAVRGLPASRAVVEGLPEVVLSQEEASHGCAVCKDGIAAGVSVLRLPCKHYFHADCIRPWLGIRNTCPVCRFKLPTGDAEYDRRRSNSGIASAARQGTPVQPEVEDKHIWKLAHNGQYSAKSAYEGFFLGATIFEPWERIWKSWAPPKCRFFMWLVAHDKCWTADRLARRGLPCVSCCPLCDQEEETIDHLLVACVFAREFWFHLLKHVNLHVLSPQPTESSFLGWWEKTSNATEGLVRQGINSLIILGAWTLWNHRNRCVFDGFSPNVAGALVSAKEERRLWTLAGARGLSLLTAPLPGD